ncbi:APC membrane recruitment protein 3 [Carlito syrichta]|uniref:APC membrane recruitment protein 3 n=1 Tax=Carlito syrichta TaxID=1868482 RepID=A0A3Q0DVH7_CARSF|nr:APC membrane recruitment protein 3 [Carlito syrichta]
MELKRGKTFIKSSLQISREKAPEPAATALAREDIEPWPVPPGGEPRPLGEPGPQACPSPQGFDGCPNKGTQPGPDGGPAALRGAALKPVRKSRTHDSVPGAGRAAAATGRLAGSASFPGSPGGQRLIDCRHLVPQVPFVPAVAKSIPRKRISLKRPKKCFRNLFHLRRNKTESLTSLAAKGRRLSPPGGPPDAEGQQGNAFLSLGAEPGPDGLGQDLSDSELLADSSFDLCRALCEDVASLQSFDSLTGCGEIFADESSLPALELSEGLESPARVPPAPESKGPRGPSQGSVEQLASPAQNAASDLTRFWDDVNRSVRQQQRALLGPWLSGPQGTDTDQPRLDTAGLAELPLYPSRAPRGGSKASSVDTGTPKSEQPESVSTSDEGYYDSLSPGLEEDRKEAAGPGRPAAACPQDSYSGDALYELFHDPSEGPAGPNPEDDLCVSESLSGPALGMPLSMCSFHVGAEENLAPAPGPDLLSQGFLQSSWKGKECLLKLCDTELAITMGVISWLRRGPAGAVVHSTPSRQELWAHPGSRGPLPGENVVPGGPSQETGAPPGGPSPEEGLFSSVWSAASVMTDTSGKNRAPSPSAWPSAQKEPSLPGSPGCFRGPWKHRGGTLDAEPAIMDGVARVAALQLCPDSRFAAARALRKDTGGGPFGQPQARGPEVLPQTQPSSSPRTAARGLPSLASPPDQRWRDPGQDLGRRRAGSTRTGVPDCVLTEAQPLLQLSTGGVGQVAGGRELDSKPPLGPAAGWSPQGSPPEAPGLTPGSQQEGKPSTNAPECRCKLLAHGGLRCGRPDLGTRRPAMAEPHP